MSMRFVMPRNAPRAPTGERSVGGGRGSHQPLKPTSNGRRAPVALDDFGLRVGTVKSTAAHMYRREVGATLAEVKAVTGSVQFNVLTELEARGFTVERKQEPGFNGHTATRFFLRK